MEILINPNISYVLLILGFLIAVLALFAPGTGFLEFSALVALVGAGYGIANLPINAWAFSFIVLGGGLFCLVLILPPKRKALLMTLAALAFLLGSTLLFRSRENWLPTVNPILILLIAPVTLGLTWFLSKRIIEATSALPAFDLDRLVGMTGQITSDIRGRGTVYVNGEEWTAESPTFIPTGCSVRVIRRKGLTLEVELINP